jgi:hypothetical protein
MVLTAAWSPISTATLAPSTMCRDGRVSIRRTFLDGCWIVTCERGSGMRTFTAALGWRPAAVGRLLAAITVACGVVACASHRPPPVVMAPKYPEFPKLDVPADLTASPELRRRFEDGWQRLQGGDLRGANTDFSDVLKQSPDFYPAETALGYVALAQKQYKQALSHFSAAVMKSIAMPAAGRSRRRDRCGR